MKLVIQGTEYPLTNINEASLDDLMALRKATGMGVKSLRLQLEALESIEDFEDVLEDEDALLAIGALVWLARRKAGEKLTLEQACNFPLTEMSFVEDADDATQGDDADPLSEPGSSAASTTTLATTSPLTSSAD